MRLRTDVGNSSPIPLGKSSVTRDESPQLAALKLSDSFAVCVRLIATSPCSKAMSDEFANAAVRCFA